MSEIWFKLQVPHLHLYDGASASLHYSLCPHWLAQLSPRFLRKSPNQKNYMMMRKKKVTK